MIVLGLQGQPHPVRAFPGDVRGAWDCGWYHDSAAVLMIDGVVVAAIEEERLTRRKHTGKLPLHALKACLEEAGCKADSVDVFAFGEEGGLGEFRDASTNASELAAILQSELGLVHSPARKVKLFEHHLCHAVSAYAASAYEDSLIFTADGFGDGVSGYVMSAHGRQLEIIDRIAVAHSLGAFYQAALPLLGFGAHDEFKMMGLAPYGDPRIYRSVFADAYRLEPEGSFRLDRARLLWALATLGPPREADAEFSERDANVAAAAQAALEEIVLHHLGHHAKATGQRRLCAAGGVMQNCSMNGKLAHSGLFDEVFVQPASTDCGLALGAAHIGHLLHADEGALDVARQKHVYLGRSLPDDARVAQRLERWKGLISFERSSDVVRDTASLLASGNVVGWVQGRSEFGPRALGNRSILADPRHASNKDRVNAMVKKREAFRPFAPAVRREDADRYFDLPPTADCAFMTFVVPVREDARDTLGATTHVDGTARVQVVDRSTNPLFWELIGAFGEATGVPVVLNTSFNNNHEPIVDSVDDAVSCFLTTGLDALVIGPFVAKKSALSSTEVLRLVPQVQEDVCVATAWASGANGKPQMHHVVLTGLRQIRISAAAYGALVSGGLAVTQADVPLGGDADVEADAQALAGELMRLWEERAVSMRPRDG
jgi:carbamoyltransferase